MLSEELHDFRRAVIVTTPEIQVSLRLHDFFMGELEHFSSRSPIC